MWGLGPTFQFPTASTDFTGSDQWSAGPAAYLGWIGEERLMRVFPKQWWSYQIPIL